MEKELDSDVIKATQTSLGKYVKRPPLSEKLLRKPPFRFLHDIVATVMKTTGFFEGLFESDELVSENVKDRESKIIFLSKVIAVLNTTTGKTLAAKPSKIVAGQEPEHTNELLQCIAFALDNKLSSTEAVKKVKDGGQPKSEVKTEKSKEHVKTVKKSNDVKKLTSRSSEKLTSNKRDVAEKVSTRNDKDKISTKSKPKEIVSTKKTESPPKKGLSQQSKTLVKKNSVEKSLQSKTDISTKTDTNTVVNNKSDNDVPIESTNNDNTDQDSGVSLEKQDFVGVIDVTEHVQQLSPRPDQDEQSKFNSSYTIVENDLNSSLSSQDLMEVNHGGNSGNNKHIFIQESEDNSKTIQNRAYTTNEPLMQCENDNNIHEKNKESSNTNNSRPSSLTRLTERDRANLFDNNTPKSSKVDVSQNVARPKSVRPSSSRPGAPRLRDKHDNTVTGNDNLLLGKVNIIVESTPNEEQEDSSIIIVDQQSEGPSASKDQPELQLSSNQQHGALVQQILDSQKEYSQTAGKTEIEWQFGAQKAREAVNQEVEQLRYNIQALSRVANPLGKILDHIQEDVEVMRQELQQWTKTYEEASKELHKEKSANEDSLFPLHAKVKQLDADIAEKHEKINDLKIVIHKNSLRIEKLLAGGDVQ